MGHRYGLRGPWVLRGVELALPARALVRVEGANGAGGVADPARGGGSLAAAAAFLVCRIAARRG
ncbi:MULTISPECIES: hypothetical protein [unclassified Streptomyces]|uniref:hypothetical protein n=1 Tax=unclassified Streptomyces TaxID=2593676 RepID=UPI00378F02F8